MTRIRGLVLETRHNSIVLLTDTGEYVRVPVRGQAYSIGSEVTVDLQLKRRLWPLVAAACLALALILWPGPHIGPKPAAYLVIDLNPSVFISLKVDGTVLASEGINPDGASLLEDLDLVGMSARLAVDAVLTAAYHALYLAPDRDNIVLVCLAAPPDYAVSAAELQDAATAMVRQLGVDAFVATPEAEPGQALAARARGESINAAAIRESLVQRGVLQPEAEPGNLPAIREMLKQLPPGDLFERSQQVRGHSDPDGEASHQGPPGGEDKGPPGGEDKGPPAGHPAVPPRGPDQRGRN